MKERVVTTSGPDGYVVFIEKPLPGETRTDYLRVQLVAVADELRDQELPGQVRQAVETIRHWRGE